MKKGSILFSLLVLLCAATAQAAIMDAPHNENSGIRCADCHSYSLWWQYSPAEQSQAPDHESIVSAICLTCHDSGSSLPVAATHSAAVLGSTTYHSGNWGVGCTDCHNPHYQDQLNWLGTADPFLLTGTISLVEQDTPLAGQTTLTYSGATTNADWPAGSWAAKNGDNRGLVLIHDTSETVNSFMILSDNATTSQIVVDGLLDPNETDNATCTYGNCASGCNTFGLIYGQLIRDKVDTPFSGQKSVQFFDANGGFVDTTLYNGICQVCHTQTLHYRNDGSEPGTSHLTRDTTDCTTCHSHESGFKGSGGHDNTHFDYAPVAGLDCSICHTDSGAGVVADLHGGTCGTCHEAAGGGGTLKQGDQEFGIDGDARNEDTGLYTSTCADCHDSNTKALNNVVDIHHLESPNSYATNGDCTQCHIDTKLAANHTNLISDAALSCSTAGCHENNLGQASGASIDPDDDLIHDSCTTCHELTSGVLKGAYGRADQMPDGGVGSDNGGGPCANCHTSYDANDHVADHDSTDIKRADESAALDCSLCHAAYSNINTAHVGQTIEVGEVNGVGTVGNVIDCATCHSSTVQAVIDAIAAGTAGTTVFCADCHGLRADTHGDAPAHDFLLKSPGKCTNCHDQAGSADVVADIHKGNCATCHNTTDYSLRTGTNGDATLHGAVGQGNTSDCTVCHVVYDADFAMGHVNEDHALIISTTDNSCDKCHTYTTSVVEDIHSNNCELCHTDTITPTTDGSLKGSAANHTVGQASDCASCHTGRDGNDHVNEHDYTDLASVDEPDTLTCTNCHASFSNINSGHVGRSVIRGNINGAGTIGNTIDCATCHSSTVQAVIDAIAAGKANTTVYCEDCHGLRPVIHPEDVMPSHTPFLLKTASQCTSCHDQSGNADVVSSIHSGNCGTCHNTTDYSLRAGTNGDATQHGAVGQGNTSDCTVCHDAYNTDFATGHQNETHDLVISTTDNSCDLCHTYTVSVVADIHNNSCELCHTDTTTPGTNGTLTGSAANHTSGAASNCNTCHGYPDHPGDHDATALARADEPVALDCATCHPSFSNISNAHVGLTVERGNLSGAATIGTTIDCTTCHSSAVQAVLNTIVAGKAGTTVYCADCHNLRTTDHPVDVQPDHAAFLPKTASQCTSCHDQSGSTDVQVSIHTDCFTCHTATYGLANSANGDATQHTSGSSSGCAVCHTPYDSDFATGHKNEDHALIVSTMDNSCDKCHTYTTSVVEDIHSNNCELCHTDTTTPGTDGSLQGSAANHTVGQASDCAACHTTRDGNDHVSEHNDTGMARVDEPATLSCATCHPSFTNINTAHVGLSIERGSINGAGSIGNTIDCATCHSSSVQAVIDAITDGKTGTTAYCADCHGLRPVDHPVDVQPDHSSFLPKTAGQCTSCHDQSGSTVVQTGIHSSCLTCHTADYGLKSAANGDATQHTLDGSSDCTVCHASYDNDFSIGHKNEDHTLVISTTDNSCDKCHTYTTSVVVDIHNNDCELCHTDTTTPGTNGTLKGSAANHTIDLASDCAGCHTTRDANDHVSEHNTTAMARGDEPGGLSCSTCHSSFSNINTAHVGLTIERGTINGAGSIGSTISCSTCHSSSVQAVVDAIIDGKAGTTNYCADCHGLRAADHPVDVQPDHSAFLPKTAGQCTSCHDQSGTVNVQTGIHGSCLTCHDAIYGLRAGSNGDATQHTPGGSSDCTVCHDAYNSDFALGHKNEDHGLVASTTNNTCDRCHTYTTSVVADVHGNNCQLCHMDTTTPGTNGSLKGSAAGHTIGQASNCADCHTTRDANDHIAEHDATAYENASTQETNQDIIGQCAGCHDSMGFTNINSGHVGRTIGTGAINGAGTVGSTISCATCHSSTVQAVIDAIADGKAGTIVSCADCHGPRGPVHGGHPTPDTIVLAAAACMDCHDNDANNPKEVVADIHNNTCANCHTTPPALADPTDKPKVDVIVRGGNCETCHGVAYSHANETHAKIAYGDPVISGDTAGCTSCHNASPLDEHIAGAASGRTWECATCHGNPCFDTVISDAINGITATVYCTDCHTEQVFPHGGSAAHQFFATDNCALCHVSGPDVMDDTHSSQCGLCHVSPSGGGTLQGSAFGNTSGSTCEDCHGTKHDANHNHLVVPSSQGCDQCHASGSFSEVVGLHWNGCVRCHDSTDPNVIATIDAADGSSYPDTNGTDVSCENCHVNGHHDDPNAQAGDCAQCHKPEVGNSKTRNNLAMPTQLACAYCHMIWPVDVMGEAASNDAVVYALDFDPNLRPNQAPLVSEVHRVVSNADPIDIYDFAACFACHGATGDDSGTPGLAPKVKPFHGLGPAYTGDDGNGDYGSFTNDVWAQYVNWGGEIRHPGHGAFNTLNSQLRGSKGDYNNTSDKAKFHDADGKGLHGEGDATYQSTFQVPWANYTTTVTNQIDVDAGLTDGTVTTHTLNTLMPHLSAIAPPSAAGTGDAVYVASATWNEADNSLLRVVAYNNSDDGETLSVTYTGQIVNQPMTWNATLGGWEFVSGSAVTFTEGNTVTVISSHANGASDQLTVEDRTVTPGGGGGGGVDPHDQFDNLTDPSCATCHTGDLKVEHMNRGLSCSWCHAPCATPPTDLNTVTCDTCHGARPGDHPADVMPEHSFMLTTETNCVSCHSGSDVVVDVHNSTCATCHNTSDYSLISGANGNGDATLHTLGSDSACSVCHPSRAADFSAHLAPSHSGVGSTPSCVAAGCHDSGDVIDTTHTGDCLNCHTDMTTDGSLKAGDNGRGNASNGPGSCAFCHTDHLADWYFHEVDHSSAGLNAVLAPQAPATAIEDCTACHTAGDLILGVHDHYGNGRTYVCQRCHDSSGSLVAGTVGSAQLGSGGNAECATCHSSGGYDYFNDHNHSHTVNFNSLNDKAQGNYAPCTDCHGSGTESPFSLDLWSDILGSHTAGCATCHAYTDDGKSTPDPIVNATVIDNGGNVECLTCHEVKEAPATHGGHPTPDPIQNTTLCGGCHTGSPVVDIHNEDCLLCHTTPPLLVDAATRNYVTAMSAGACTACHTAYFDDHTHDHGTLNQVVGNTATDPITDNCTGCHSQADVVSGIHQTDTCGTCHDLNGDGSLIPPAVTGGGECNACHTNYFGGHGHTHQVSMAAGDQSANTDCNACHSQFTNDWFGILGLHLNDCSKCHDETRQVSKSNDPQAPNHTIQDVISSYADPVACLDCHYDKSASHMPDHGVAYVTATPSCVVTGCHDQPDHVDDTHKGQCSHCHADPENADYTLIWLAAGNTTPPANECITCHDTGDSFYIHHEFGVKAKQGDCDSCHIDPRASVGQPLSKQLACRECHMEYDYSSRTLTVVSISVAAQGSAQATGTEDGNIRTPVPGHTFNGGNGVVKNYGACLECHGATGRSGYQHAPRMNAYHALKDYTAVGGVNYVDGEETIPGEQFRTGFTGELYKTGVGNSRKTHYIGIDGYFGPGRGIFNIGFAPHSLPKRWLQDSVFQRNLNRMWEPWMNPKTSEPYTFFEITPQLGGASFFVPKFEDVNFGSSEGVDEVVITESPEWHNRVLTVRASSSSNGAANLNLIYGGVGYPMTYSATSGVHEVSVDFSSYPEYAYNSQVLGTVWVVSGQGGNANYGSPTYTTPTGDDITITSAQWLNGQLTVSATNSAVAATLTLTYNGQNYTMTMDGTNEYSVTVSDPVFVPLVSVTSDAGGNTSAPAIDEGQDNITVITAEWVQNNTGRELTVRATNTVAGAELVVVYNGQEYQMAEDSPNLHSRAIEDIAYVSTLDVISNAEGGGSVTGFPVLQLFENEDHPYIVPGIRGSAYIDTLTCFTNYCHSGNSYDEHLTPGGIAFQVYQDNGTPFECTQCHEDAVNGDLTGVEPSLDTAIQTGATSHQSVYCSDCHKYDTSRTDPKYHDPNYSIARQHHENAWEVKDGDCTICHIDPRVDPYGTGESLPQPKMLPCMNCHVDADPVGGVEGTGRITVYKSRTGSQVDPYNGNVDWQWQFTGPAANTDPVNQTGITHQWDVEGGMIRNFGVCLFCHKMRPYHAKPAGSPIDTDMGTIDQINDPPHFAGPGRGTLGVFYGTQRKETRYYHGTNQSAEKNSYRDIRDQDAIPIGGMTYWANITYDPQDPNRYIPGDHTLGVPEYFTIPTFDQPEGGDNVTITGTTFRSQDLTLEVHATNTVASGQGVVLYAIHHGESYPMVEDSPNNWSYTFTDLTTDVSDNPGRVYVISIDPSQNNAVLAQDYDDVANNQGGDSITVTLAQWDATAPNQLTVHTTNTNNNAVLTVYYGANSYPMLEVSQNTYELQVSDENYYSTASVISDGGGETFFNVTDISPPADNINVTRAEWNGNNVGSELLVEATNTQSDAILTVHYNSGQYEMTQVGTNTYSVTASNNGYAAQLTVTSDHTGSSVAAVSDVTPQNTDHPHIVPGIRNSPYSGTMTCFTTNCHAGNTYDEHLTAGGRAYQAYQGYGTPFDCTFCHQYGTADPGATFNDDPVIQAAISTGVDSQQDVYCSDCHAQNSQRLDPQGMGWDGKYAASDYSLAQQHHMNTAEARAGNCVACHIDPRLDPYGTGEALPAPKQLPCQNCHAEINPSGGDHGTGQFTVYKSRTGTQVDPYGGNVSWDWQFSGPIANTDSINQTGINHQWNVDSGNIESYGVCLFCHKMRPYHAKPEFPPADSDMSTLDMATDPPHFAGPGRATLGVFYPFYRKPSQYYKNAAQRGQNDQSVYRDIRDNDALPREDITWWSNVVYDPQSDPHGMVPGDHVMGVPEYFTIPTFDPPVGGDTVTIGQTSFSNNRLELDVSATNTASGVILYVIHGGERYAMTEGPANDWNVTISGYPQELGDNAGRIYVISVDPNGADVLLDQAWENL